MAKGRDTIREETKKASLSRENLQTTKNLREISLCIKLEWEVIFFFSINGPNSFKTVKNNLYYKKQHFKRRNWYVSITFIHINYFSLFFLNCKKSSLVNPYMAKSRTWDWWLVLRFNSTHRKGHITKSKMSLKVSLFGQSRLITMLHQVGIFFFHLNIVVGTKPMLELLNATSFTIMSLYCMVSIGW